MVISIILDEVEQLFVCFVGHSSFFFFLSVNCIPPCALDCPWVVCVMGLQVFFMKC